MLPILVDTDILIDIANDDATAKFRLRRESEVATLAISTITAMELTIGCRNKAELRALQEFLAQFSELPLTSQVGDRATQLLATYYLSHGLLIADALVAATAIEYQIPLLSKNQRDFRFIATLELLPYP